MIVFILALLMVVAGIGFILSHKAEGEGSFHFPSKQIGFGILAIGIMIIIVTIIVTIPAGHRGVIYDPLAGGVLPRTLGEGLHIVPPWQSVAIYSMRTSTFNMHKNGDDIAVSVLTGEGLDVTVDVSVIYHLDSERLSELHRNVGEEYREVLIKPVSRATARDLISTFRSEDLYTTEKRVTLQNMLTGRIRSTLEQRGILVESILIRDIELPTQVKAAIESKITAEQDAKRMEFVLQKESKEAERKVLEAKGVSESQKIISESLSERYLTWFWISTLEKQKSVIYVPTGQNGLPLFKNIDQNQGGVNTANTNLSSLVR